MFKYSSLSYLPGVEEMLGLEIGNSTYFTSPNNFVRAFDTGPEIQKAYNFIHNGSRR